MLLVRHVCTSLNTCSTSAQRERENEAYNVFHMRMPSSSNILCFPFFILLQLPLHVHDLVTQLYAYANGSHIINSLFLCSYSYMYVYVTLSFTQLCILVDCTRSVRTIAWSNHKYAATYHIRYTHTHKTYKVILILRSDAVHNKRQLF